MMAVPTVTSGQDVEGEGRVYADEHSVQSEGGDYHEVVEDGGEGGEEEAPWACSTPVAMVLTP